MGIMLCSRPVPAHAFFVEELGIRVFSAEELCFCVMKYPLLFLDDFPIPAVCSFLKDGARMPELAEELRMMDEKNPDEILCRFVERCGYAERGEASRFRGRLEMYRKLTEAEYLKKRGDLMFSLKKFGKAAAVYERIVTAEKMRGLTANLKGLVLFNEGSAWANLFLNDRALRCYAAAYGYLKSGNVLKRIYFLSRRDGCGSMLVPYRKIVTERDLISWKREYEAAAERAAAGPGRQAVAQIFDGDPVKRSRKEQEMVRGWKAAYRAML